MAADQLTDKEDQFKRRARRRLVGAVALVLLMITVLPMVLDDRSGQKVSQPEITISIPSQNGAEFTSKIIPVAPVATPPAPVPAPPVAVTSPPAAAEKQVPVKVQEMPKAEAIPVQPVPIEKLEAAAVVAEKVKPEPVKSVEVPNKAKPTAIKKGSLSVQIGVFSDAAKVKQMRAKIAEKNIPCYTENMATPKGTKYRVRCGPYSEKPSAQLALETLKSLGYSGILVTNQ